MIVAALILLIIAVLLIIAALFGGGDNATIDLGSIDVTASAGEIFFMGAGTLLLLVISVGLFRTGTKRASARRADRKKVSELSEKLDDYKREERENAPDDDRDRS